MINFVTLWRLTANHWYRKLIGSIMILHSLMMSGIAMRYQKVSIPGRGVNVYQYQICFWYPIFRSLNLRLIVLRFIFKIHWSILIDFDLTIIICNAKIACTNFKYFEGIEKYRGEGLILGIGMVTKYLKVSIL